jgi:hypothetical protein
VPKQTRIVSNVPRVLGAVFQENRLNGNLNTAVKVLYTRGKDTFIIGLSHTPSVDNVNRLLGAEFQERPSN